MMIATLAGDSAVAMLQFFSSNPDPIAIDRFCTTISENRLSLPIVYFCEWGDRWLMGNDVPGPNSQEGKRYQASCMTSAEAVAWAEKLGDQYQEQLRFASRLREAAYGWGTVTDRYAIMSVREVMDGSTRDDEVEESLNGIPKWWPLQSA